MWEYGTWSDDFVERFPSVFSSTKLNAAQRKYRKTGSGQEVLRLLVFLMPFSFRSFEEIESVYAPV